MGIGRVNRRERIRFDRTAALGSRSFAWLWTEKEQTAILTAANWGLIYNKFILEMRRFTNRTLGMRSTHSASFERNRGSRGVLILFAQIAFYNVSWQYAGASYKGAQCPRGNALSRLRGKRERCICI